MKEHDFLKYLRRNPVEIISELADFSHAVVVPAYDEIENIPTLLKSLSESSVRQTTAVIVVVNYPAGAEEKSSEELYEQLQNFRLPLPLKLFPIFAPALENGVGEARKIGFDTFCRSRNCFNADTSVMFSLDADCRVHTDYFDETLNVLYDDEAGCAVIGVAHRKPDDPVQAEAICVYEKYLLDYEENLSRCKSPYAYNAIGSGFAVKVRDYIRSGGMKLKKAGEDFYFLQSVAKCSKIVKTARALVYPSARISDRVPFGTGTAVRDIISGTMPRQVSSEAFSELKKVLEILETPGVLDSGEIFLSFLSKAAAEFFVENNFAAAWNRVLANQKLVDNKEKIRAFHLWFDALQTRRFLHRLSES